MSHFTGSGGNDFIELESGLTEIVSKPTQYTVQHAAALLRVSLYTV